MLPGTARQVHIFSNTKHSLASIVSLCDVGCTVIFRIKDVTAVYKNNIIQQWCRNHQYKLWYLPLSVDNEDEQTGDNENNLGNNAYKNKNQAEFASFLHPTCFSLVNQLYSRM